MTPVIATTRRASTGTWLLKVKGPFCGHTHHHGGGSGATPSGGWRQSHCRENAQQYQIVPVLPVAQPDARSVQL